MALRNCLPVLRSGSDTMAGVEAAVIAFDGVVDGWRGRYRAEREGAPRIAIRGVGCSA